MRHRDGADRLGIDVLRYFQQERPAVDNCSAHGGDDAVRHLGFRGVKNFTRTIGSDAEHDNLVENTVAELRRRVLGKIGRGPQLHTSCRDHYRARNVALTSMCRRLNGPARPFGSGVCWIVAHAHKPPMCREMGRPDAQDIFPDCKAPPTAKIICAASTSLRLFSAAKD